MTQLMEEQVQANNIYLTILPKPFFNSQLAPQIESQEDKWF